MDLTTDDARAWRLAPRLDIAAEGLEAVSWINPLTGTVCRLERTGDYEVWHRVEQVLKPVVVGKVLTAEDVQFTY